MIQHETPLSDNTEAGIISFKNLKSGFIKFNKIESENGKQQKSATINQEILIDFTQQLKNLILEIFNPEIDFIEKEV
jgi:hypothetical protein